MRLKRQDQSDGPLKLSLHQFRCNAPGSCRLRSRRSGIAHCVRTATAPIMVRRPRL